MNQRFLQAFRLLTLAIGISAALLGATSAQAVVPPFRKVLNQMPCRVSFVGFIYATIPDRCCTNLVVAGSRSNDHNSCWLVQYAGSCSL